MGRMLDALLRRKFKATKFKTTVNLAVSRLTVLKNHRQGRLTVARSDTIQFLKQNYHEQALLRVDQVIKEQNMIDVLVMVDGYCHLLLQMVDLIEKERNCPDELKEAVSSLLFVAPRCGEFPELQQIRAILTARYGKEFANDAIELRNNCGVNIRMIQKLSPRRSSLDTRMKVLQEIAIENDIVLKLNDSPPVVTEGDGESMNGAIENNSGVLRDDFDEMLSFSGVEDAAQAAFESAAYAAAAARAAVLLSRPRSFGSDDRDSPNSGSRKVLDANNSKLPMKYEKTQETESESEPEHEGERSKNGSDESDNEIENETIDSSSSELRFGEGMKMQQGVHQLDVTKRLISARTKPVY